ncbi:MAG: hypothetical protein IKN79_02485 [Eubacterium sp.]|nr:hypothetical protein [Eubacterium sp.]
MKSKKWIVITIISLVLIAAALVFSFVWMLPMINKKQALNKLAEGDETKVAEIVSELDKDAQEEWKKDVEDIVVYTVNQYLDGKKNYDETFKVLQAVEQIRTFEGMTAEGFRYINIPKLEQIYVEAAGLFTDDGNDAYDQKAKEFERVHYAQKDDKDTGLYYNWDSKSKDDYKTAVTAALDAKLKEKYDAYTAGTLSYEDIKKFTNTARSLWYSEYAYEVSNDLYYDELFQRSLEEFQKQYDEKNYFDVMDNVKYFKESYANEKSWSRWESRFDELYKKAEEEGPKYYEDKAIEYASKGEIYYAEDLMDQMKRYYGDNVDLSKIQKAIKDNTHEEWMEEYVSLMDDWKKHLTEDLKYGGMTAELVDCSQLSVDIINPQYVMLYDFDNSGIPELILRGTEYMAVYAYNGNNYEFSGVITPMGVGNPPYVVVGLTQEIEEGIPAIAEALIRFKDEGFFLDKIVATTSYNGEVYYLGMDENGDATVISESDYNKDKEMIEGNITGQLPVGVSISDYKEYIYSYTN